MSDGRSWADLPLEILSLIRPRLLWENHFNFKFTCRSWNFPDELDRTVYKNVKYPFLLRFSKSKEKNSSSSASTAAVCCRAYSPAYHKTYYLQAPADLSDAHVFCSGYGWLLCSGNRGIFFYCPSTEQVVHVPYPTPLTSFHRMSFSAPPTSPDCVVLGLVDRECAKETMIRCLRRGQTDWQDIIVPNRIRLRTYRPKMCTYGLKKHTCRTKKLITSNFKKCRVGNNFCKLNWKKLPLVKGNFFWPRYNSSPIFHKGVFYCLTHDGRLGVFNPKEKVKNKMWRLRDTLTPNIFKDDTSTPNIFKDDPCNEAYLVECKGELIAIVIGSMGKLVRILRFYKRARAWQIVHSLGDHMVFLSHVGCVAIACKGLEAKGWKNTIHFPRFHKSRHIFYSLSSEQFHSFDGEYTSEDLYDTELPLTHAWMNPVFSIARGAQLDWTSKLELGPPKHHVIHPYYVIRNLNFLLPPPCDYLNASQHEQLDAPIAQPCLVLSSIEEDGEVVVVNLVEEITTIVHGGHSRNMAAAELAVRIGRKTVFSNVDPRLLVLMDHEAHTCSLLDLTSMTETSLPPFEPSIICMNVVVQVPPSESRLEVIAFGRIGHGEDKELDVVEREDVAMVWRDGDEKWTMHTKPSTWNGGITVYQGKIYGYQSFNFVTIELRAGEYLVEKLTQVKYPESYSLGSVGFVTILVESCGELLFFVKSYAGNCLKSQVESSTAIDIKVFQMDFEVMEWRMLEDLGDRAFFWNDWGCYSCCASKSGCRRNSIYFIERYDRDLHMYDYGNHSISVTLPRPDLDDWWVIDGFFMLYS